MDYAMIQTQLKNAITSKGLTPTTGALKKINSVPSITILANQVWTKLQLLGYKESDVGPAIAMYAESLAKDWKGAATLTERIVAKYTAAVPAGDGAEGEGDPGEAPKVPQEERRQEGGDDGAGDGGQGDQDGDGDGDQKDDGQGDQKGKEKAPQEGGEQREGEGEGEGDESEEAPQESGDGDEQEVESDGAGDDEGDQPQPQPQPRVPEPDGYMKPSKYDLVLGFAKDGYNILLTGPKGAGKTEMAFRIIGELEKRLFMLTSPQTRYEVTGYQDANGKEVPTQITLAITQPSGLLIEEMDRSMPEALIPLNAMLANKRMDVPGRGVVEVDPQCLIIATANTSGNGADDAYGTAQQLDASTLDRFVTVRIDYEREIDEVCAKDAKGKVDTRLVDFITEFRRACEVNQFTRYMVSYRGVKNFKQVADKYGVPVAIETVLLKDMVPREDLEILCNTIKCRNMYAMALKNHLANLMKE